MVHSFFPANNDTGVWKGIFRAFTHLPCVPHQTQLLQKQNEFFFFLYTTVSERINPLLFHDLPFKAYACIGHAGLFTVTSMVDPCAHGIRVDTFGTNEGTYSQGAITIVDRQSVDLQRGRFPYTQLSNPIKFEQNKKKGEEKKCPKKLVHLRFHARNLVCL